MANWTEGYVAEADYVTHYTPELNPQRAPLLFANAGLAAPERIETACELGFGLGLGTNIHAAASATAWSGNSILGNKYKAPGEVTQKIPGRAFRR